MKLKNWEGNGMEERNPGILVTTIKVNRNLKSLKDGSPLVKFLMMYNDYKYH